MTVVTRIAPSPTGFMHIGTARTALYNWLFARRHGGKFHIRIEDTDRARHSEEAVLAILNGMKWLGLEWDGEVVSQFERRERHAEVAYQLLHSGKAWKCYYSQEELEKIRKDAGGFKLPRRFDLENSSKYKPSQTKEFTIRIEAPLHGISEINDRVQGQVTMRSSELDDFVLLRSDGTPTYMLAVVVDDHDAGVTHIIRGDDHLNNAFRQKIIYEGMGWAFPEHAHIPLIHGPDGAKLSKRHGAQGVHEYEDMGYLPEAMRNYLLRLGWSHGDDEIIPTEKAVEWFNLENIGRAPARLDFAKLDSLNAHYIQNADNARLLELMTPFLHRRHDLMIENDNTAQKRLLAGMDELKKRAKTLLQLTDEGAFYAKKIPYSFDEKAQQTLEESGEILKFLHSRLSALSSFTATEIETACKAVADESAGGKLGKVAMPLRAALTGTTVSPSIFHAAEILGRDETLARVNYAGSNSE